MPESLRPTRCPLFAVTVDLVVLTIRDGALCTLLVEHGEAPYKGRLALPGGFVQGSHEDLGDAAPRAGGGDGHHDGEAVRLEQLAAYGHPRRDPRIRVVSVAHLVLAPNLAEPVAGSDAAHARWMPVDQVAASALAFDHHQILADGVERARAKLEYTTLATTFCGPAFTISELRHVYEVVWGTSLNHAQLQPQGAGHRRLRGAARRPALQHRRSSGAAVRRRPSRRAQPTVGALRGYGASRSPERPEHGLARERVEHGEGRQVEGVAERSGQELGEHVGHHRRVVAEHAAAPGAQHHPAVAVGHRRQQHAPRP